MNKYEEALNEIRESYRAYTLDNATNFKYNTHRKQFELLNSLNDADISNALNSIVSEYDCYFKNKYDKDDEISIAFECISNKIKEL
nr:MAG TPA: hypothetical protein [Caudoviricetes sp.]